MPRNIINRSRAAKALVLSSAVLAGGTMTGCDNAGEGLFSGAALGAVSGLIIGSTTGNAGEGAAIGAAIGGASGAVIGDQNQRNRENAYIRSRGHRPHGHDRTVRVRVEHDYPYCSRHRAYHSCSGHSHYHYDEWWRR